MGILHGETMSVMTLSQVRRTKEIKKRGRFAVPKFCGWPNLAKFVDKCKTQEVAALFAVLFETGCRISEALMLHKDMFIIDDEEWLTVYRAPVLKKKVNASIGDRFRNIPILRSELLVEPMMDYLKTVDGPLFTKTRQWAWYNIVTTDEAWWCHRIRSERATQLHVEYGYEVPELMKFFNWSEPKEALEYVKLDPQDLKDKVTKARNII